ncbi:inositol polyphosphate 5-phosphatase [Aureococcus anophagefferens]|uniref:Inositol polyphosphate 5-phosphatase n=1 Tax=Aureococcus anophagefferens TaxID=44056 RepID=A0ABR1G8F9_AURAN
MDRMSPAQLATYRYTVVCCGGLSLLLTTVTLGQIARKGGNVCWLVVSPLAPLVPSAKRRAEQAERRLPIYLRLNAFTSLSYWLLSLTVVAHVPLSRHHDKVCNPTAVLLAGSLLTTIIFSGFVAPRLTLLIVHRRRPLGDVAKRLRRAATVLPPLCYAACAVALGLRSRHLHVCVDLPRTLVYFQVPLVLLWALAFAHGGYAGALVSRAAARHAAHAAGTDEERGPAGESGLGAMSTTSTYRQFLFGRLFLATWIFYVSSSIWWAFTRGRVLSPMLPPFWMTLANSAILSLAGSFHCMLTVASDAFLERGRFRAGRLSAASDEAAAELRNSLRRAASSVRWSRDGQDMSTASLVASMPGLSEASSVDGFAFSAGRGAEAVTDLDLFMRRALPGGDAPAAPVLERSLVATTMNCAEAKTLRELLVGEPAEEKSVRAAAAPGLDLGDVAGALGNAASSVVSASLSGATSVVEKAGLRPRAKTHGSQRYVADAETLAALKRWLPRGRDVYAVAVQECMCWDELRCGVVQALNDGPDEGDGVGECDEPGKERARSASSSGGRAPLPETPGPYVQLAFTSIGSRRIKGHIGVAVFARRADVEGGYVRLGDDRLAEAPPDDKFHDDCAACERAAAHVPLGTNLGVVGRSANKGCAGLRVRVGDAHCAFLCAHLPADASGHARRELRNACAGASLKSAGEQMGFMIDGGFTYAGAHLAACTHAFFLGDLNYRSVPPSLEHARRNTLGRVAEALAAEASGDRDGAERAWDRAVINDELGRERRAGRVFASFDEPPLRFAPTFRRKMGPVGVVDASAAPGADALCEAYTLFKDESKPGKDGAREPATLESALARARQRLSTHPPDHPNALADAAAAAAAVAGLRSPSWTDRVLVHSLPRAKADLDVGAYDSVELPGRSDHHPVRLACVLRADPARVDLLEKAAQDRCDAVDVTVALDNLRVEGFSSLSSFDKLIDDLTSDGTPTFCTSDTPLPGGASPPFGSHSGASSALSSLGETEQRSVKQLVAVDGGKDDIDRASLFFPLPVEDVHAARRHEAAVSAALEQRDLFGDGESTAFADRKRAEGDAAREPWDRRAVKLRADRVPCRLDGDDVRIFPRHCLVSLDTREGGGGDDGAGPGDHRCCAFALVPLPEGPPPCEADFRAPLSLSGHARGTLVGRVSLSRPRGRSRSQPGKPGARERPSGLGLSGTKSTRFVLAPPPTSARAAKPE